MQHIYTYQPMSALIAWNHPKTLTIVTALERIWILLFIEMQSSQWLQDYLDLLSKSVAHRYVWLGKQTTHNYPTHWVNVILCNILWGLLSWWDVKRSRVIPSTGANTSLDRALYFAGWEARVLKTYFMIWFVCFRTSLFFNLIFFLTRVKGETKFSGLELCNYFFFLRDSLKF